MIAVEVGAAIAPMENLVLILLDWVQLIGSIDFTLLADLPPIQLFSTVVAATAATILQQLLLLLMIYKV